MQQYPQSPDMTGQTLPPVYPHDQTALHQQQQQQGYAGSPAPQQPQAAYSQPLQPQPGMPPQQPSGPVYQNAVPIANLQRGPAPADCPACGQRSMTNTAYETGGTTQ